MIAKFIKIFILIFAVIGEAHAGHLAAYIYADEGTCEECIKQTELSLRAELASEYLIKRIKAIEILESDWQHDAALLVIPGGIATPYAKLLNGEGNAVIRAFVEQGGSFLGICAGGYYGCAMIEFARGTKEEVIGARELAFFPGTTIGPALAPHDYYSERGARAAKITWTDHNSTAHVSTLYYNGGGYFTDACSYVSTQIVATYDGLLDNPAAIIETPVEKGVAILSGVHFEYNSYILPRIEKNLGSSLGVLESQRKSLLRFILSRLRLNLSF
jgi:biotin--protein ligase